MNPVSFDQNTAYQAAVDHVNATFGMPPDAYLSSVNLIYTADSNGNGYITGYVFTWLHNNNLVGGDRITIVVDDYATQFERCIAHHYEYDDLGRRMLICDEYATTYTHTPNVSYHYRLWRALSSGTRYLQSAGRTTGSPSIDALTASYSLPVGSAVSSYIQGWYSTDTTGSANDGAEPVWLFTMTDGTVQAVDAFSGQYIGIVPT